MTLPPALSVRQPWAHWIVFGDPTGDHDPSASFKDIENRTWSTDYRGPLFIHASKGVEPSDKRLVAARGMNLGGIIGVVDLVDVIDETDPRAVSPWWLGPFGLVLSNPRPLAFMPCRGTIAPLLWPVPDELRPALAAAIAAFEAVEAGEAPVDTPA